MVLVDTIIYDLGAVLIDWNPEHLYKKIISDEKQRRWFLENITTSAWNEEQDAGRPLKVATELLVEQFPEYADNIRAYYGRWPEMLNGPIEDSVKIFKELREKNKYRFLALTNWSSETFPIALEQFDFLHWFDGRVVSGEEKTRKPFKEFYEILLKRYAVDPKKALFIDDNKRNLVPANELGMSTIHFTSASDLRKELSGLGVL